jgi:hypothetical protein
MSLIVMLSLLAALLVVGLLLRVEYRLWREATERERFMLALKEASTPQRMEPADVLRLKRLRSPGWAVWRWLFDRWRQPSLPRRHSHGR